MDGIKNMNKLVLALLLVVAMPSLSFAIETLNNGIGLFNFRSTVNSNFNELAAKDTSQDTSIEAKQNRVSGSCPAGQYVRAINADGSTVCESDSTANVTVGTVATLDTGNNIGDVVIYQDDGEGNPSIPIGIVIDSTVPSRNTAGIHGERRLSAAGVEYVYLTDHWETTSLTLTDSLSAGAVVATYLVDKDLDVSLDYTNDVTESFTAQSTTYVAFEVTFPALDNSSDLRFAMLNGGGGNIILGVRSGGAVRLWHNTSYVTGSSITPGTYYMWLKSTKGTGSNGTYEWYIGTTNVYANATLYISGTDSTVSADADEIVLTSSNSDPGANIAVGRLVVSDSPIGDL